MTNEDRLDALKRRAVAFRDERDWAQFHHPKDLALGLTVFAYLVYSGLLARITVEASEPKFGDLTVAYKTGTGAYRFDIYLQGDKETVFLDM